MCTTHDLTIPCRLSRCLRMMRTIMIAFWYMTPNLRPRKTTTDPCVTQGRLKYSICGIGPVSDIFFPTKSTQPSASRRSRSRSARQSSEKHLAMVSNIYRTLGANLSTQLSFELPYCDDGFIEPVTLRQWLYDRSGHLFSPCVVGRPIGSQGQLEMNLWIGIE